MLTLRPLIVLFVITLVCSAAGGGIAYAFGTSVVPASSGSIAVGVIAIT